MFRWDGLPLAVREREEHWLLSEFWVSEGDFLKTHSRFKPNLNNPQGGEEKVCTAPVFFPDPSTFVPPEVKTDYLASVYSAPMRPWKQLYHKYRNLSRVERHLERRAALPSCQK